MTGEFDFYEEGTPELSGAARENIRELIDDIVAAGINELRKDYNNEDRSVERQSQLPVAAVDEAFGIS